MRWLDQLATVVEMACSVEYRTSEEQRALLDVAAKVDRERGKDTTTNPHRVLPYLEELVDGSRLLTEGERRVRPPSEVKAGKRQKPSGATRAA